MQYLRNEATAQIALLSAQQAHRNYAKRQLTWFRREPDVMWFHSFGDDPEIHYQAAAVLKQHLGSPDKPVPNFATEVQK